MLFIRLNTVYSFSWILPKNKKINIYSLYSALKDKFPVFSNNEEKFKRITLKTDNYTVLIYSSGKLQVFVKGEFDLLKVNNQLDLIKNIAFQHLIDEI